MIYDLTRDGIAEYVSAPFVVLDAPAAPVTLQLTEVTPQRATSRQEMFSLMFHGPADHFMPQNMYRLEHERLGEFQLLLVPIGRDQDGYVYEAVFNRLIRT
ncbi:MAG: hypothetical protein WCF84_26900 [Anaerolineae bacterium]